MSGTLPALRTSHGEVISVPHKIITHLRKEVCGLGRGTASESLVNSVLHTFIEYQVYAKPDAGDPGLQGTCSLVEETQTCCYDAVG